MTNPGSVRWIGRDARPAGRQCQLIESATWIPRTTLQSAKVDSCARGFELVLPRMSLILVIVILVLLFGGGGFYMGGPRGGGISLGAVLLIILVLYLLGVFR